MTVTVSGTSPGGVGKEGPALDVEVGRMNGSTGGVEENGSTEGVEEGTTSGLEDEPSDKTLGDGSTGVA